MQNITFNLVLNMQYCNLLWFCLVFAPFPRCGTVSFICMKALGFLSYGIKYTETHPFVSSPSFTQRLQKPAFWWKFFSVSMVGGPELGYVLLHMLRDLGKLSGVHLYYIIGPKKIFCSVQDFVNLYKSFYMHIQLKTLFNL